MTVVRMTRSLSHVLCVEVVLGTRASCPELASLETAFWSRKSNRASVGSGAIKGLVSMERCSGSGASDSETMATSRVVPEVDAKLLASINLMDILRWAICDFAATS